MNILLSGGSGLIGSHLAASLERDGHCVKQLVRRVPSNESEVQWNSQTGEVDLARIEGHDAAIHLSGDNIASGRWTAAKMERIRTSRVDSTRSLCEAIGRLNSPPHSLLCASAVGIYGDRGDEVLDEESEAGSGFLPEVGVQWEEAAHAIADRGLRVVNLRFGVVLTPEGGALAKMLPAFKWGLGGRLGNGRQWMSWISLADAIAAICFLLENRNIQGPVNVVAPNPVSNRDFTKALGAALHRPTIFPVPGFALRSLFGRMADEALLASARVVPAKLEAAGFKFAYPTLEGALKTHLRGDD